MITLAITNFNRYELLMDSFARVLYDPRISEVIISDDCSDYEILQKVLRAVEQMGKVKVYRNAQNLGMSRNKAKAISYATNEWVIILDSDNVIAPDYLDALQGLHTTSDTIYLPEFAKPQFDFTKYSGLTIDASAASSAIKDNTFNMAMNCCNYYLHKDTYLANYNYDPQHIASDTIWFAYNWLKNGNRFCFVPGMQYLHRVHDGSGFLNNVDYNLRKAEEIRKLISQL